MSTITRVLPGRLLGPRTLAPRLSGRSSGTQTATHLAFLTQPGGAVSGVPLTIQPTGQALDGGNSLDTTFGGTISAVVSSGTATVTAGGAVSANAGAFAFTGLTITGSPGLVTITLSSGTLTPVTSVTFLLSAAAAVTLALSPTRVTTPARVGRVGDAIDFTETLKGYDKVPQNLTGASVVFSLDGEDGVAIVSNGAATILNAATGQVTYRVPATTVIPVSTCTWRYRAVWDASTKLSFPDDSDGTLTIMRDLP